MINRIVCAANRYPDGTVVLGIRHWDQYMHVHVEQLIDNGLFESMSCKEEQGFIDSKGVFHDRTQALEIAKEANQIIRRCGGDEFKLFSENLY